jgi:hypothetical protein
LAQRIVATAVLAYIAHSERDRNIMINNDNQFDYRDFWVSASKKVHSRDFPYPACAIGDLEPTVQGLVFTGFSAVVPSACDHCRYGPK